MQADTELVLCFGMGQCAESSCLKSFQGKIIFYEAYVSTIDLRKGAFSKISKPLTLKDQ